MKKEIIITCLIYLWNIFKAKFFAWKLYYDTYMYAQACLWLLTASWGEWNCLFFWTAPIGVRSPYSVKVLSGFEISASWYPPQSSAGLLSHYILMAYNMDKPQLPPAKTIFTDTSIYTGNTSTSENQNNLIIHFFVIPSWIFMNMRSTGKSLLWL